MRKVNQKKSVEQKGNQEGEIMKISKKWRRKLAVWWGGKGKEANDRMKGKRREKLERAGEGKCKNEGLFKEEKLKRSMKKGAWRGKEENNGNGSMLGSNWKQKYTRNPKPN